MPAIIQPDAPDRRSAYASAMGYRDYVDRHKARKWMQPYGGAFGGFVIITRYDDGPRIGYRFQKYPAAGTTAVLEASLAQGSHTAAGWVVAGTLLAGPVGAVIGAVAKKDIGKLFVTVTLDDGAEHKVEFANKDEAKARKLVENVNALSAHPMLNQMEGQTMSSTPSTTPDPTVPDPYQPAPDPDSLPLGPDYAQPKILPSHGDPDPGPVADPGQVPDREPLPGE